MSKKLSDIMGDAPDTEVVKSVVKATVVKKTGDLSFKIKVEYFKTTLEVDKKLEDKITVGYKFQFFSPEKCSPEKLKLTKKFYAKKLALDENVKVEESEVEDIKGIKFRDLVD